MRQGNELRRCRAAAVLALVYRWAHKAGSRRLMQAAFRLLIRLEGGEMVSRTARELMRAHHQLEVGAYSYGCFDPVRFQDGAEIGRYVSIARSVRCYRRNHPVESLSTHPVFFSARYGAPEGREVQTAPLSIGHDAWIGAHAVILPGCRRIGTGAIVAAGSVLTRDVEPYAIVAGNPARPLRSRFDATTIQRLLHSRWWEEDQRSLQHQLELLEQRLLDIDTERDDR